MPNKTKIELQEEIRKLRREVKVKTSIIDKIKAAQSINAYSELSDVFENVGVGISLVNIKGITTLVNSFLAKMLGYTKNELLKMPYKDYTYSSDFEKDQKLFKQLVNGKLKFYHLETRFIKKSGTIVWGKLTSSSILDKNKKIKLIIRLIENTDTQREVEKDNSVERKLLQALMQYSPDSIYFKDLNSKFIRVNLSKAHKHGFKKEEDLIGKSDFDLYVREHALQALKDEKEIISTGCSVINKEETLDWQNGKKTWVSTTKMPLRDDSGKIIGTFGITRDISDRVIFEHGLKESEERYRTLYENSADGILMISDTFEDCNSAALDLFSLERNEIIGHHPAEFSPILQPDGRVSESAIKELMSSAISGKPQKFYWRFIKTNENKPLDSEVSFNTITLMGKKILQATIRDISEQLNSRKVENAIYKISEAAQTSEDINILYKNIHSVISELMTVKNFYIAQYNEKLNILSFPYFVDEFDPPQPPKQFGKGLTEYIIRKNEAMLISAKKDLELRESGEVELIGAPQAIWLGVPLKLGGKTIGVMVVQDYEDENAFGEAEKNLLTFVSEQISQAIERKKNTEAIKHYTEELVQLNKTKDKFFSILAHDLRNPFITILGFSDLLITDYHELTNEERLFYVEEMKKSAEISHNLLQNLLQWSRSQTGRIEYRPTNILYNRIISTSIELIKPFAVKKDISIRLNLDENINVFADEDMTTTLLRNLLTNAVKFTNKGGDILIVVESGEKFVETSICDNGIGMDEETTSRLFQLDVNLSMQGTENESGTGLGLLLCKEFVEKNGGTIKVKSQLNKGSVFSFKLPRTNQHSTI